MYLKFKNVRNFITKSLVICLALNHQVSTHSLANRTGKSPINRKNDRLNRYFNKNFDELSNRGSELRQSADRSNQKLNISLTVSNPMFNEFTEMQTQEPFAKEFASAEQPECQCTCDPYQKANELISEFVLNDNEDPDMDIDDNEELEKLQKPYKYIPMETIELAHQRPQLVTSTPTPPSMQNKINNLVQSVTNYLTIPKFSTKEYLELGVSLVITGVLGFLGFSPYSPYQALFRRSLGLNDRNSGYYNRFYMRQLNDTDDPISTIYHWIQSLD